ncbi:MAG: VWA domain-containing protein [Polyangiaceae bacterium]|nr:VWA domain-containing protein [Polyangiaceae bacterium]
MSAEELHEPSSDEMRAARVTTYVLGEMSPDEAAAFELELEEDEALAGEVEEMRAMSDMLTSELGRDVPAPPASHKRTAAPVAPVVALPARRSLRGFWLASLGLAAALGMFSLAYLETRPQMGADAAAMASAYSERETTASELIVEQAPVAAATAAPMYLFDGRNERSATGNSKSKAPTDRETWGPTEEPVASNDHGSIVDNPFIKTSADAKSTFSIDVDTASYSILRGYLTRGQAPPAAAVRIEELINYFSYAYPKPDGAHPFSVNVDVGAAPWAPSHRLVRVGMLGKEVKLEDHEGANLVFLVDSSGSMSADNKLPLLRESLKLLLPKLSDRDSVSIVAYAGSAGLVLPATPGDQHQKIQSALDRLAAGGSTNGGEGIELAYAVARDHFIKGGVNRVILCTDGDFNVGITSGTSLVDLVKQKAQSGVFLSVLGFGMGNLKDGTLEQIADKGNGNYAYVDNIDEGRKVLAEGLGNLVTIAKDVKIQVTFDPKRVESFRLIGYENRVLAHKDFNDDTKDAGDLGSGHTVTALYEVVTKKGATDGDLLTVQLRYKDPDGSESKLIESVASDTTGDGMSADFRFAAGVAAFGMMLRNSPHKGSTDWGLVTSLLRAGVESDGTGRRRELLELVEKAKQLSGR